jgi:hypothetical protein
MILACRWNSRLLAFLWDVDRVAPPPSDGGWDGLIHTVLGGRNDLPH